MSDKSKAVCMTLLTAALVMPLILIAYGTLFGHSYTTNQATAAVFLAFIGLFPLIFAFIMWIDL